MRLLLNWFFQIPAAKRASRKAKHAARRVFAWPFNGLRKNRLDKYELPPGAPLPIAELDLERDCGCRSRDHMVRLTDEELRPLTGSRRWASFAPTPVAIEMDRYPDFMAWRRVVSRNTDGKYHRSANKARRLGYATRVVGLKSHARSLHALTGSKPRRSKGILVWASLVDPAPDLVDTHAPPKPPTCPRHWRISWGVFRPTEDGGETLSAFAILIRAGDVVWIQRLLGHGEALADGVTKMLMFDIMEWMLARREPCTQGIRHVVHGFVEEGSVGLFDWKRYLAFTPRELRLRASDPGEAPPG